MITQIAAGIIIGVAVAIASTVISHLLMRSRERERWERETQAQHRADRLELYRQFLVDVRKVGTQSDGAMEAWRRAEQRAAWRRAEHAWSEIELLGSEEVRQAADGLFNVSTLHADAEGTVRSNEDEGDDEAWRHNRRELERLSESRVERDNAFVAAVRKELGVDVRR